MKKLAIVSKNRNQYSETFIHLHLRELPFENYLLFGDYLPHSVARDIDGDATEIEMRMQKRPAALKKWLKRNKIECVLAEYGPSGVEMSQICAELGIPLVVHFHGYDAYRNDILSSYGASYPALFKSASSIVAVSNDMVDQLVSLGADRAKIRHIPYGVDVDFFTEVDAGKNQPHFLMVGRCVEKKAQAVGLLAFRKHLETNPDSILEVIGDGHLFQSLRMLSKTLGIEPSVLFHGQKSHGAVREAIAVSRAVIQPSHRTPENDMEGLPLVVLEALSSGVPVIGTRHGGIPDVVGDGANGFLVNEWDWSSMAEKMDILAREPGKASELGKRGAALIRSRYGKERYLGELGNQV